MGRPPAAARAADWEAGSAPTLVATQSVQPEAPRQAAPPVTFRGRAMPLGLGAAPLVLAVDILALAGAAGLLARYTKGLGLWVSLATALLILCLNGAGGQYRPRLAPSVLDDLPGLLGRALVAGAVVTAFPVKFDEKIGEGAIHVALGFILFASVGRAVAYWFVRRTRAAGRVAHGTLILGAGQMGDQLARTLLEHPEYGLRPVGFLDDDPLLSSSQRSLPLLGGTADLPETLTRHNIRTVIVAFGSMREHVAVDVLRTLDRLACEIFTVPRFHELHAAGRDTEHIWGVPLYRLRRAPFRSFTWRLKRVFDAIVAALCLVVMTPFMALCALAVRLEGGSGVIFKQQRVGLDGRSFTLLKFRSLRPVDDSESATHWNLSHDPRMGAVGRFMRRTSLDELPQLWNVLRGDMSLVGPRPERPYFVEQFSTRFPRYFDRHRVPAGITGWAQVSGLRGDTSIGERARFDNYYIENWSLWEDIKILLRTMGQVVGYRGG